VSSVEESALGGFCFYTREGHPEQSISGYLAHCYSTYSIVAVGLHPLHIAISDPLSS
jgi:hypothetical protein